MEKKSFFKSTSFKCIITLLLVLLVSGIFLTIMNSLLAVTDQERFDRAINKIYGKNVKYETVAVGDFNTNGKINEAYRIEDGNYLIKATGFGGFDNGTVTCWVVVNVSGGAVKGIDKVVIDSNKGQSYIGNINDKFLAEFNNYNGEHFDAYDGMLRTGATMSATAICNAVNASIDYVNEKWLGNVTTEGEKLLTTLGKFYEGKEISVYGANDTLITVESDDVTSFIAEPVKQGDATVESLYKVKFTEDGNEVEHYVVSSTGTGGYNDGTVTCLTAFTIVDGKIANVYKVSITANVSQSFIGNINYLDKFSGVEWTEGLTFTTDDGFKTTGASMSSTAINNSVNGGLRYVELNLEALIGGNDADDGDGEGENDGEDEGGNENE